MVRAALDRAAELLNSLPTLWHHVGVTDQQRQELLRGVFEGIYIEGRTITAIRPNPQYLSLFAYQVVKRVDTGFHQGCQDTPMVGLGGSLPVMSTGLPGAPKGGMNWANICSRSRGSDMRCSP